MSVSMMLVLIVIVGHCQKKSASDVQLRGKMNDMLKDPEKSRNNWIDQKKYWCMVKILMLNLTM
jgi:hypothetical protein